MIALGIIFAILLIIALLRFGVSVEYSSEGVTAFFHAGPFGMKIYPVEKDPTKEEKNKRKKAEKKAKKEEKVKDKPPFKMPGGLKGLLDMIPPLINMLGRFKRRLLIKNLTLHLTAAGDDAYKTAMTYGAASAGFGVLTPLLENNFRIKKRDFQVDVDFLSTEQKIYVKAAFSFAVWELFYITAALFPILKILFKRKPAEKTTKNDLDEDRKEGKDNGKTSNK